MQFSKSVSLILALALSAAASPIFTTPQPVAVTAGSTSSWAYSGAAGPVTITLKTGDPTALGTVEIFPASSGAGTFTWTVPDTTVNGIYALEISDGTGINYSAQFTVSGGASGVIQTIATSGSVTAVVSTSTGSSTTASSSATMTTTATSASTTVTSTRIRTATASSSTPASTTAVGNLNAAGSFSASPLGLLVPAFLAIFAF